MNPVIHLKFFIISHHMKFTKNIRKIYEKYTKNIRKIYENTENKKKWLDWIHLVPSPAQS
jgi:accessory colonization factor AcfC